MGVSSSKLKELRTIAHAEGLEQEFCVTCNLVVRNFRYRLKFGNRESNVGVRLYFFITEHALHILFPRGSIGQVSFPFDDSFFERITIQASRRHVRTTMRLEFELSDVYDDGSKGHFEVSTQSDQVVPFVECILETIGRRCPHALAPPELVDFCSTDFRD
eukprot:gnl/Chilomastix_cuspidata/705.p2 GENE.gnl/Chilomastix_cuspidata/705~~gnl/Chilomastix_cuspidata/705.p2  ORF type:complete len:160 (+),score=18.69 gnl/Chilomastix_cuspidata/705:475-954(+)